MFKAIIISTIIANMEISILNDIFAEGIKKFENAINIIKKGAVNWDSVIGIQPFPIRNTYTEEGLEYMYKLQNNWRYIRPQLKPYSMVNLPQIENLGTLEEFKRIFEKNKKISTK